VEDQLIMASKAILESQLTVALTGAGMSVESGIPPFRGKGGVWEKIDPIKYAHIDSFLKDPEDVWNVLIKDMQEVLERAIPNDAHEGLSKLEQMGKLSTIITQNVDGLHQLAGNSDVIEFHGSFAAYFCMDCNKKYNRKAIDLKLLPPRCDCGGIIRPDVVFFGEMIPPHHLLRSEQISTACDVMIVIGTSALVQPAALMPVIAKNNGARIIEINLEKTPLTDSITDYCLLGKAGEIMNNLVKSVAQIS